MIKKIIQNPQVRCNFCFDLFIACQERKDRLNLCKGCLTTALDGHQYVAKDLDGRNQYRVYVQKKVQNEQQEECEGIMKDVVQVRDEELKNLSGMWRVLEEKLDGLPREPTTSEKLVEFMKENKCSFSTFLENQIEKLNNIIKSLQLLNIKEPEPPKFLQETPLKFNSKIDLSPELKVHDDEKLFTASSCLYLPINKQNKHRQCRSPPVKPFLKNCKSPPKNIQKKSEIDQLKLARDLEAIKKNALKFKIYEFLVQENQIPMTLLLIMTFRVYDAIKSTQKYDKCMELVLYNVEDMHLKCYLNMLEWKDVEVFKLVKVGLTDQQMPILLNFLTDKRVESLVITSNKLTQQSCKDFLHVHVPSLKNIYLGKNKIQRFRLKEEMKELEDKYNLYL